MSWIVDSAKDIEGGYWFPHSSSVDFCEPNYALSPYIAEFHNSWSSLVISLIALLGIFYGNPTNEWRFFIGFFVIFLIGIGSFLLHMTLHYLTQSSDELPMLWASNVFFYILYEVKTPIGQSSIPYFALLLFIITVIQTCIYYIFQTFYLVFIASFIFITAVNVILGAYHVWDRTLDETYRSELFRIWSYSFYSFVIVGAGLWILDMNFCKYLLPYYKRMNIGMMTFHVVWHVTAGYGAYLFAIYLGRIRVHYLKTPVKLKWILGVFPIWEKTPYKRS